MNPELVELHDLAVGRLAHYRYVQRRLRQAESNILACSTNPAGVKALLEGIVARCNEWEGEAAGEVFAFREVVGRRPRPRGRETSA